MPEAMGRLPRTIDDGLVYHALNRGNDRADVFSDDADRFAFLDALAKARERYPFRLFGYCLMTNHFRLLLRPEPGQSISRILQSLTVAHIWRYHKRHLTSGHVWQGQFESPVIEDDTHLLVVLRYVEANPAGVKIVNDAVDYRWSSYFCHAPGHDDALLSPFTEWDELGRTEAERRRRWRTNVHARQGEAELPSVRDSLRSARPLGTLEWTANIAQRLNIDLLPRPRGRPRKDK
jgi:putative transposase